MHVRLISIALAALFAAPPLSALPYSVELRGSGMTGVKATLHATRVDGVAEPIRREITVPSSGSLPDVEGTWELRLESERVWAAPVYTRKGDQTAAVVVALPAARIQARVATADAAPAELQLFLTPADEPLRHDRSLRAQVACPIRDEAILCTVPAGSWDMQFAPAGFVPQYRWNVELPAERLTKLERIPLVKGASVVGTVMRAGRSLALPADTVIRLVPATLAPQEARAVSYETKPNAKGFFQIVSVPPGEYFLTASSKSLTSDSVQIIVIANRTAELRAPLVIDTPRRVRVTVAPKVDPDGEPWLVSISVKRPGARMLDSYSTSKVDAEGVWEQKGLRDGEYLLTVERAGGGQWLEHWFTLAGGDLDLPLLVPLVEVEGTVSYGDQPISARVTFGGEYGSRRQLLHADHEGEFKGVIPEPEEESWDVSIEADAPPTRLTLEGVRGERKPDDPVVRFDLRLPRTAVFGSVVHTDGSPVSSALVRIRGNGKWNHVDAHKDGTFQISGMAPGVYEIMAEEFLASSEVLRYEIREDDNPPLRLVVKDVQQLKGRVVTAGGVPVIGASVAALPANAPRGVGGGIEMTNENGAFALQVRADVSTIDVLIVPPGFATIIGRTPVRADRYMEVTVDQRGGSLIAELPPGRDGLLTHEGATWSLAYLTWAGAGLDENTAERRRFRLASLQPGEYTVCVLDRCKSGYVPPHGTLQLSLK